MCRQIVKPRRRRQLPRKRAQLQKKNRLALKTFASLATLLSRCRSISLIKSLGDKYTCTLNKVEKEIHGLAVKDSDTLEELDQKLSGMGECAARLHHSFPETAPKASKKPREEPLIEPADAEAEGAAAQEPPQKAGKTGDQPAGLQVQMKKEPKNPLRSAPAAPVVAQHLDDDEDVLLEMEPKPTA